MRRDILDEIDVILSWWKSRRPLPMIPNRARRHMIKMVLPAYLAAVNRPSPATYKTDDDLRVEAALWRWAGEQAMADRIARILRVRAERPTVKLTVRDLWFLRTGQWAIPEPSDGEAIPPEPDL